MKEVKAIDSPTVEHLLAMAANLKEKFGLAAMITVNAWDFNTDQIDSNRADYAIYIASSAERLEATYRRFTSWKSLEDYYFSLINSPHPLDEVEHV